MERRVLLFVILSVAVFVAHAALMDMLAQREAADRPPDEVAQAEPEPGAPAAGAEDDAAPGADAAADADRARPEAGDPAAGEAAAEAVADDVAAEQPADAGAVPEPVDAPVVRVALGSAAADSRYRMLVTLTSEGSAIERIELNEPRFSDIDRRHGYLGHLALSTTGDGVRVGVVGPGTPAALAGVEAGDELVAVDGERIRDPFALDERLARTRPGQVVTLSLRRDGELVDVEATLRRYPVEIVRPEGNDPLSLLVTLEQVGEQSIPRGALEMAGVRLRRSSWELVESDEEHAEFRAQVGTYPLELIKRYRLEPDDNQADGVGQEKRVGSAAGYHLVVDVELRNTGQEPLSVAYRLDGPTGLPTEGAWYTNKIGRSWFGGAGLRDIVVGFWLAGRATHSMISTATVASDDPPTVWRNEPLLYAGVDAQYFSSVLIPQKGEADELWFAEVQPIRVGAAPAAKADARLTNTSVRLSGVPHELAPGAEGLTQRFVLFAGPKKPAVLEAYGLGDTIYYGWFGRVSQVMLVVLHFFYGIVGNYGIAIVMLTVLVRSMMFPLSRKQALSAQKMQELQPKLKEITEKYKNNVEQRTRAQQELFRQHNYNPLGGCLLVFLQLPIFIGLYRALSVDVELRQAPLISESIRWASNLAAPDMLFRWDGFMPNFVVSFLGPYFNVLPLVTIALFIIQQKMFMPPPTDEQSAMQQKVMQYMMIFFGLLFFKVPSGLCVYFIASSLWGVAERKLLPKARPAADAAPAPAPATRPLPAAAGPGNGQGGQRRKKQRGRR